MITTTALLLILFLLFLTGIFLMARKEAKATVRVHRRGANGTGAASIQVGTSRSFVPSSMAATVRASFIGTGRSIGTQESSEPRTLLRTLTARSSSQHRPLPREAYTSIPVTETPQSQQEAVSKGFPLSPDPKECVGAEEASVFSRSSTLAEWLSNPCCRLPSREALRTE